VHALKTAGETGIGSLRTGRVRVSGGWKVRMILLYQTHSPYARKVLVFAHECGLEDRLHVEHHETSPTNPNMQVYKQNPLGKVPVLIRPDLPSLFDSDVICAYLDEQHSGRKLIPSAGEARWLALRLQAAAQGLADTAILLRWETVRRPAELRHATLAQGYHHKLIEAYDWLEANIAESVPLHVGHIAVATALSWMRFRDLPDFADGRPRLAKWFAEFEQRHSMLSTPLSGETVDTPQCNDR
jgi:glutathione S-transferase